MVGPRLSHQLKYGRLRWMGKPLYEGLVATQLRWVAWRERKEKFERMVLVDEKLTAVIKTFERPQTLRRLVRSIRRWYPELRILIADDSREPTVFEDERIEVVRLPYDSGVSLW